MFRTLRLLSVLLLASPLLLAGCGDTWQGVKKDTKENVRAVGKGVEKAGEKIQDAAD